MKRKFFSTCACLLVLLAFPVAAGAVTTGEPMKLSEGLYAELQTNKGVILLELYYRDTPMTVANFVGLSEGSLDTRVKKGQPFYDGLTFHRVIAGFMIQGGDPSGDGTGGPGYRFPDEIRPNLKHDSAGILSMANAGPGTNGSQFFITHAPAPHLDGLHTVFGRVVSGQEVVNAIAKGDVIRKVTILRVGPEAERFVVNQEVFNRLKAENAKQPAPAGSPEEQAYAETIKGYEKKAKNTKSGLKYVVLQPGKGAKPSAGQLIEAEYTGRFMDGRIFDTSVGDEPLAFNVGTGQVIPGWDEALLDMKPGESRVVILPPDLAYGEAGAGNVIPPGATLFFEIKRIK